MSLETKRERKEKGGERGEKKKGLLALIIFILPTLLNDKKVLATHRSDTSTERYRFKKSGYVYIYIYIYIGYLNYWKYGLTIQKVVNYTKNLHFDVGIYTKGVLVDGYSKPECSWLTVKITLVWN